MTEITLLEHINKRLQNIEARLAETPTPKENLSVKECAELMGLGRSTIYELMDLHELDYSLVGGRRIIPLESARACIKKHLITCPEDARRLQDGRRGHKPQLQEAI